MSDTMKHYAICENKCLVETYSKDEIDKKISNIEFKKISGSFIIDSSEFYDNKILDLNYPTGYDVNNTRILCVNYWRTDRDGFGTGDLSYRTICSAECHKGYIRAFIADYGTGSLGYGTYQIEVYLMKVEE